MNRREFMAAGGAGVLGLSTLGASRALADSSPSRFPQLAALGERYRFAIIADPQLGHREDENRVPANARRTLIQAVAELNAMTPAPDFVVFLGDLVNKFDENSVANFEECIRDLKAPRVIVHGNHDTHAPYTEFRALMQRQCGFGEVFYSFDAGPWHYVVLPCNLDGNNEAQRTIEAEMLAWLEADLAANAQRRTVIFEHLHTLPIGLAQTEWYTFPLPLRKKLMALYTRHGNVRWYFNGHVHNGFAASVKTSWRYRDINFVNCPTIIEMRNFGEELAPFEKGIDEAGYYVLVDVAGETFTLSGRRAGQPEVFQYPASFRAFEDRIEPRWWSPVAAWTPKSALENATFAAGLAGWEQTYRYPCEKEPGSEFQVSDQGVGVVTRSKVSHFWANDEYTEACQLITAPGPRPMLSASFTLPEAALSGGGYVRVLGLAGEAEACLMMWHWGENEARADYLPRSFGYMVRGERAGWNYLNELAARQRGLYWHLGNTPGAHTITADLAGLFDAATGAPGGLAGLGIDRYLVAFGTWANRDDGAQCRTVFHRVSLAQADAEASTWTRDGQAQPLAVDGTVFQIGFAGALIEKQRKQQERAKRKGVPV